MAPKFNVLAFGSIVFDLSLTTMMPVIKGSMQGADGFSIHSQKATIEYEISWHHHFLWPLSSSTHYPLLQCSLLS